MSSAIDFQVSRSIHASSITIQSPPICTTLSPLLVLVCLPDRESERSSCNNISPSRPYIDVGDVPNPTAMNDQYLTAKNFVNGLNGMFDRGPSG